MEEDGVAGLVGSAAAGLVLALGFVALMARVNGPTPVEASWDYAPAAVVAPDGAAPEALVQNLYDGSADTDAAEGGAH